MQKAVNSQNTEERWKCLNDEAIGKSLQSFLSLHAGRCLKIGEVKNHQHSLRIKDADGEKDLSLA